MPVDTPDYSSGVALMLRIPPDVANKTALPDGVPAEDLHITVASFGNLDEIQNADEQTFLDYATQLCAETMPFTVQLNGITRFSTGENDPLVVNADAADLEDLRRRALDESPIPVERTHGYSPHMTIAYLSPDEATPVDRWDPIEAQITEMIVAWGPDETVVRLGDAQTEEQPVDSITAASDAASATPAPQSATPTAPAADSAADPAGQDATPDLPNGKPMMFPNDTLALTLDDNENVLELIYSDETGVYVRDNGQWTLLSSDDDAPTVWDHEWRDVPPSAIAVYDEKRDQTDTLKPDDIAPAPSA